MFREDDNRPPSAPCYDRQANLPIYFPPNAEFSQTIRNIQGPALASTRSSCILSRSFPFEPVPKDEKIIQI